MKRSIVLVGFAIALALPITGVSATNLSLGGSVVSRGGFHGLRRLDTPPEGSRTFTADYKGRYSFEDRYSVGDALGHQTEIMDWAEYRTFAISKTGEFYDIRSGISFDVKWKRVDLAARRNNFDCQASVDGPLSPANIAGDLPVDPSGFTTSGTLGVVGWAIPGYSDYFKWNTVNGDCPMDHLVFRTPHTFDCVTLPKEGDPQRREYYGALATSLRDVDVRSLGKKPVKFNVMVSDDQTGVKGCGETASVTINSTYTLTGTLEGQLLEPGWDGALCMQLQKSGGQLRATKVETLVLSDPPAIQVPTKVGEFFAKCQSRGKEWAAVAVPILLQQVSATAQTSVTETIEHGHLLDGGSITGSIPATEPDAQKTSFTVTNLRSGESGEVNGVRGHRLELYAFA